MSPPPDRPSSSVLRLDQVSFRYSRRRPAFGVEEVSFEIRTGETCALMGHNGSGKTTLLRLSAGLLRPQAGRIALRMNGHEEVLKGPRRGIGYIPQHLGLLRARTVEQNVLIGALARVRGWRSLLGFIPDEERSLAREWIRIVGLSSKSGEKVYRLSGGERQRVAIARALMQRPKILLADEFASNLDPLRQREILEFVRERVHAEGVATLIAVHDLELARRFADRILFVHNGRLTSDLPAADVTVEVAERHLVP